MKIRLRKIPQKLGNLNNKKFMSFIYGLLLGNSYIIQNNTKPILIVQVDSKHNDYMNYIYKKITDFGFFKNNMRIFEILQKGNSMLRMLLPIKLNSHHLDLY